MGIKLSDGTVFKKSDLTGSNPGTSGNPIELPVAGQKLEDIITLIPATQTSVTLNALVNTHHYWGDADGDGNPTVSGSGTLTISAIDADNNAVGLTSVLSDCSSPYQVTLTSTAGTLSTQYGAPRTTSFTGSSATYYITPKVGTPYACWAKPNLAEGGATYTSPLHPEWDGSKGFKLQDVDTPSSNFPSTGFNGAFFDITVAGATATSVIAASGSPITQGGVTATLTAASTNVVRVTLTGPKHPSGGSFTASTFEIKSSATNVIYSFGLSQWFIARPGAANGYSNVQPYCNGLSGIYRVPGVRDYTNANGMGWTGGLVGWTTNVYARGIKGGLFAEWGNVSGVYSSDFEYSYYWAVETYSPFQHIVNSYDGNVNYHVLSYSGHRAACVMP